jgi:hypothetical protein
MEDNMNTEDDEFNRIERESKARMMAVAYAIKMESVREMLGDGIPFVDQDEFEKLLKDET